MRATVTTAVAVSALVAPLIGGAGAGATAPPGDLDDPLTFSAAADAGIEVDWGERCDTERGRIAVPDFFAPECYAPFEGDNGGETTPGVTTDTIQIVMYLSLEADPIIDYITDAIAGDDTNEQRVETMQNAVAYYNTYFELYGRRIELIPFDATGLANDEVAARADAVRIAEEIRPFAVFGGPALTPAFGDELAAREVLCIACVPAQPTEFYADRDPYVFAIDASQQQKQDHVVEFIATQLAGGNAEFAGDDLASEPRTFGLVYLESGPSSAELAERFAGLMEEAGAPLVEVIPYTLDPMTIQQTALQLITRLKSAGVTTVVFSGDPVAPRDFTREATVQGYFPEWVIAAPTLTDTRPRSDLRPGAVAPRLRGDVAQRRRRLERRRVRRAVRMVQRVAAPGGRVDRCRSARPRPDRRRDPEHGSGPDPRVVPRRAVRVPAHRSRRVQPLAELGRPRPVGLHRLPRHR